MSHPGYALGVIPARAGSTRFPNKILALISGKTLIERVWEMASKATSLGAVVVATDSTDALHLIESRGGRGIFTPGEFSSGTDRVAFIAKESPAEIIVNIQGDEPLLPPEALDLLIAKLRSDPSADMATLAFPIHSREALKDPNIVKVVTECNGHALYFSRHPLAMRGDGQFLKHIGIYAYRRDVLLRLAKLPPSELETMERLEQLRALQNGFRIAVCIVDFDTVAVDVPDDILRVELAMKERS